MTNRAVSSPLPCGLRRTRRRDHEPPPVVARLGWRFHHVGVPTATARPGEIFLEAFGLHVSGFGSSPYGVEWMRFDPDSALHELIRTVPHVAFEVDDLEAALAGQQVLHPPGSPSEGVRSAMIAHDGAPIELISFARPPARTPRDGDDAEAEAGVALRFPEPADAVPLFDAVRESIAELHPWAPWCPLTYGLDDAARWVGEQPAAREAGTAFEFVVVDAGGRILGCCGVNQVNRGFRLGNLGYWIRTSATGRGRATRAARLAAEWAFANTDLQRLELLVAVENRASQAVAAKAGGALEGRLRCRFVVHGRTQDAFVYSIVRPASHEAPGAGIAFPLRDSAP